MIPEDIGGSLPNPAARAFKRHVAGGFLAASLLLLSACATERLDQYSAFATAGTAYVANFHQVTAQAGSAMIAVDSVVMATVHRNVGSDVTVNPAKYSDELVRHDQLLQTHLSVLQLIDSHATLLGSYFGAISKLTDSKTATATSAAATDLLKSIEGFEPSLAKATLGGKSIEDYVTIGTAFVVAHFEVKALDDQLQRAAPIVDRALSLQEAAVTAIGAEIKASLTDTLKNRELTDVINPFLSVKDLPGSWNTGRESYLRASVSLNSVDSAQKAIKQLHVTFKQLVENKSGPLDLQTLIKDITDMTAYANAAEATLKTAPGK